MLRKQRRGSILMLTLFILIVLQFLGMAFLTRVQGEMAETSRDVSSYYLVHSGLSDTREWLQNRANANTLDAAILSLPSGTDPDAPPAMRTYYERTSDSNAIPVPIGWRWRVRIYPDQYTAGNSNILSNNSSHAYKLVIDAIDTHSATGETIRRRAVCWVHQGSFAQFSYFFGQFASGSDLWLDLTTFRVEGPFHTNGKLRLSAPYSGSDWEELGPGNDGSTAPFQSQATFATAYDTPGQPDDSIEWRTSNKPYDTSTGLPVNLSITGKTRYDRISRLGRSGLKVNPTINMPNVSALLADAAYGSTPPPGAPNGINVVPGASTGTLTVGGVSVDIPKNINGYYLKGADWDMIQMQHGNDSQFPVNDAAMRGAGNDNFSVLMRQGSVQRRVTQTYSNTNLNPGGTYKVNGQSVSGTMTVPAGYTIIQNDLSAKSYQVLKEYGNGLFYSTGNIKGLEGMNKGRHTFSADQMSNKEIHITDELLRADIPVGTKPTAGQVRDQLGVVAYAIRFPLQRTNPTTGAVSYINRSQWPVDNPMNLYAALFAGRPNDPNDSQTEGGGVGTVQYNSNSHVGNGAFRVYGSLTENIRQAKGTFGGSSSTGMSYKYDYDTNFQNVQPPYFPAQANFDLKSWQDVPLRISAN